MASIGPALILLGAIPLNGWIGFQIDPSVFSSDEFIGSIQHFLIGGVPYAAGMMLLAWAKLSFRAFLKGAAQASILPIAMSPIFLLESVRFTDALAGWLTIIFTGLFVSGVCGAIARHKQVKRHDKRRRATASPSPAPLRCERTMTYPFQPKSTANLRTGQFWPIRLPDGGFGCGMVLDVVTDSRRQFLAGLIDWHGTEEPQHPEIEGRSLIAQGVGHVKMILEGYGWITGALPTEVSAPSPLLWTEHLGSRAWGLFRGLELIERIGPDEAETYPRRSTWGYKVINLLTRRGLRPGEIYFEFGSGLVLASSEAPPR